MVVVRHRWRAAYLRDSRQFDTRMSDTVLTALIAGVPAILVALASLVKAFKTDKVANQADEMAIAAWNVAEGANKRSITASKDAAVALGIADKQ
jgi:phage gp37-like protein